MNEVVVHVLTFEGCPHAEAARSAAAEAVAACDRLTELVEVDLTDPDLAIELRGYPSPTILVDMNDVSPSDSASGGLACRASGAPSAEEIGIAIRAASTPDVVG